ncbi:repressor of the inhibitor of the protein kinase [Araneus ventricosus]|uniref:Repressor of the inhibitor of the protein kinase n=1 Tax=Araneus ventricosus TaxID=182803 RepID=A0A4Y2NIN5_ARAVE|nr:repressor of the inhibitor of the protein kinase [Araneus ventricosus]
MSAKRTEILKSMISDCCPEQKKKKLISLCETRWVERHDSVFSFKDILEPILLSLLKIEEESSDSAPKAHAITRNNVPDSTEEEYYRRAVYVPYLDDFYNSLKERFESHKETAASLQYILPEFSTKTDFYSLEAAFNFYEEYLSHKEVVQSESMSWKEKWSQEKSENLPKTAISSLEKCDKTFFPNIYILLKLLAVVPVSVATVERSFSSLRRLKTYLRNTTLESRLNGLALLSLHRDIKIRDEEVLDKFASVPRNLDFVL